MVVRELITLLGFQTNNAQLKNAEQGIDKLKNQANGLSLSLQSALRGFLGFQAIKSVIQIGDDMQSMRTRIGMLPQTLGDAGAAFDEVARRASASGMAIDAYGKLYARIGNAAKDYIKTQDDLLGITDTISHALVVGGRSAAEASSVMLQFSQALGSGVLQGDEFRAMAEAAPQYLDKLSEAMKIPREQLKKMASDGKLTSKAVIEATRSMAGYFRAEFEKMPMTVGRATTVVANKFKIMIDKINRESLFIAKIASMIIGGLEKIEQGIDWLAEKFGGAGNLIQFSLIAIATTILTVLAPSLYALAVAISAAIWPFTLMAAGILALSLAIEDLYVWMAGGDSIIGQFVGRWEDASASIVGAWTGLKNWFSNLFDWFSDKFNMVSGLVSGLIDGAKKLGSALGFGGAQTPQTSATSPLTPSVAPTSLQGAGGGNSSNNTINKNTTVNLTVPAGTSQEQAKFIQNSAQKAFSAENSASRDISMVSP